MSTKATKVGKNQFGKQKTDSDYVAQPTVQAISVSHMAEQETDSELESDQEQLDMGFLL